jgi:hypothetical protein
MGDSAKMNIWLHKTVLARIGAAANPTTVPATTSTPASADPPTASSAPKPVAVAKEKLILANILSRCPGDALLFLSRWPVQQPQTANLLRTDRDHDLICVIHFITPLESAWGGKEGKGPKVKRIAN